ncbi:MAG: hypothetical protein E2O52_01785 [Gammaproteobacteria bacterium]|nr:MAG: hypothetical protein E2O52_01785 [Gammaproteobacteria bacterium]
MNRATQTRGTPQRPGGILILLCVGMCLPGITTAQSVEAAGDRSAEPDPQTADAPNVKLDELMEMLKHQQAQLDAQKAQIAAQAALIATLQIGQASASKTRDQQIEQRDEQIASQTQQIDTQRQAMQSLQQQVDQMADAESSALTEQEKEMRSRLETLEGSIKASQEADSSQYDADAFPGSIALPGTSAALRIGGFVKMNIVESFDPIGSKDRFIVGTIPVPNQGGQAQAALTVSQSRLNFDLRETTQYGPLRAFIEGDFAGDGDTFRLRHAYGQFGDILVGKTWTAFMDSAASPEELDFEGINGRINVRQPQIRFTPQIGTELNLIVSLEDPNAQITGGEAISQIPDVIASIRRTFFERWHVKASALFRTIEGTCICLDGNQDKVTGWGLSVSGKSGLPRLGPRDNLMFQASYGEGYGRYVNDLGTLGGMDAVFDPVTGQLKTLPVFAYYVAIQHWWDDAIRSTIIYSYVNINNTSFQGPDAYDKTNRLGVNVIWSPTPRIDLGGELLWGSRENKDSQTGHATQLQLSAKYRY